MNKARRKALEIVKECGNSLADILKSEGVQIIYFALAGRLKELYFGDFIILKSGLPEPERHELIAHALGHHFLHAGNHFFVSTSDTNPWDKLQERQAEVFAAYLLMPNVSNLSVQEIANRFTVTEGFASFRLKLLKVYKQ